MYKKSGSEEVDRRDRGGRIRGQNREQKENRKRTEKNQKRTEKKKRKSPIDSYHPGWQTWSATGLGNLEEFLTPVM
jgi:hypothetical protein